jgi:hypothetical protein
MEKSRFRVPEVFGDWEFLEVFGWVFVAQLVGSFCPKKVFGGFLLVGSFCHLRVFVNQLVY